MKTTSQQVACRAKFEARGFPRSGAAALVGNFCIESGEALPTAFRRTNLDHGSNGLAQWRLTRLTSYMNSVKLANPKASDAEMWRLYGSMDLQVGFVISELEMDYPALHDKLMAGGDVAALTADVCWQYERPNKALAHLTQRIDYARALNVADAVANTPAAVKPKLTVVDHLQAQLVAAHTQQVGAVATASVAGLGGIGLLTSHVAATVTPLEWTGLGVAAAGVVAGVVGMMHQSHVSKNVRSALSGVTPDAPPAAEVEHTAVVMPAAPDPTPPAGATPPADFAAQVTALVMAQLAAKGVVAEPMPVPQPWTVQPLEGGGATMTIGRAQPIEGAK